MDLAQALSLIRQVPDFPEPGILFQDITPLLSQGQALATVIDAMSSLDPSAQMAVGIEARGFIFASAIAHRTKIGFVPLRKSGKLPGRTLSQSYGLEYGRDQIEIHADAIPAGTSVMLVDDVLATGGTLEAALSLIKNAGGIVSSVVVLLEISELNGRKRLHEVAPSIPIHALATI
jgi:adenine phosphoribosyltransferase